MRYLLSKLFPIPMRSTYATTVRGSDVQAGGHGNHFRDDDHHDLVSIRWWQWRGRTFHKRTVAMCLRATTLALLVLLLVPALALAAGTVLTPVPQLWVLILGGLTPLVTYVLNHFAPWVTEPIKATVLAIVAGAVAALYTAIETSIFGFNNATAQLVLSAIVAAFGAHLLIWSPSGIAAKLGGGSNAPKAPARRSSV